jgi:lipopolysaccharide transport system permease protein
MSYTNTIAGRNVPGALRYLNELAQYRHLLWNLVGSDIRSRFRRSSLGILWAVIQPMGFSVVLGFVWGGMLGVPNIWTFAIYIYSGMLVWEYISNIIIGSQDSLVAGEGYLRQARIPFFVFQARQPLSGLVVAGFGFLGFVVFAAAFGELATPGLHTLLVIPYVGLLFLFALPLAMILSVLGVQFRDLKHISTILVQGLFFISPIMLVRDVLKSETLAWMQFANPIVPLLDLFRAPLLDGKMWSPTELVTMAAWISALWVIAIGVSIRNGRKLIYSI